MLSYRDRVYLVIVDDHGGPTVQALIIRLEEGRSFLADVDSEACAEEFAEDRHYREFLASGRLAREAVRRNASYISGPTVVGR